MADFKTCAEVLHDDQALFYALSNLRLYLGAIQKDGKLWDKLLRSPVIYPALTYAAEMADTPDDSFLLRYTKRDTLRYCEIMHKMWSFLHLQELC